MQTHYYVFLSMFLLSASIQAQDLKINKTDESTDSYSLTNISKITFSEDEIIVHQNDQSSEKVLRSNVAYLSFSDVLTATQETFSFQDNENELIQLFPNPANNEIVFTTTEKTNQAISFQIFQANGSLVAEGTANNKEATDISYLKSGLYICKVTIEDHVKTLKFLKN